MTNHNSMSDELNTNDFRVIPICYTCTPKPRGKDYVKLNLPGEDPCMPESRARQRIINHRAENPTHIVDTLEGAC